MSTGRQGSRTPNPYLQTDAPSASYTNSYPSYDTPAPLPYPHDGYTSRGPSSPRLDRPVFPHQARSDPCTASATAGPSSTNVNSLVPLDQAVRMSRERTIRASSTTSLPTWAGEPPYSNGSFPISASSRAAPTTGPEPPQQQQQQQQRITRKLTKHRRSSSSLGPPVAPHPAQTAPYHDYLERPPLSPSSSYSPNPLRPPLPPTPPSRATYSSSYLSSPGPVQNGSFRDGYASSPSPSLSPGPRRLSYGNGGHQSYPPVPPPPPRPWRTESEEEQVDRARRESFAAEQARLASLAAADDHLLHLTLAESNSSAVAERSRAEAAELRAMEEMIRQSRAEEERRMLDERRRSEAEEEAVRRAIEASQAEVPARRDGTGKGREAAVLDDEEEVEQALRLSMEEDQRRRESWQSHAASSSGGFGATETSAQAFARYSQPAFSRQPSSADERFAIGSSSAHLPPPRRCASVLLDPDPDPALEFGHEAGGSEYVPPPAYELPAHAPELDRPDDVIFGPGRPLPAPVAPTSTQRRPLPIPPQPQPPLQSKSHIRSTLPERGPASPALVVDLLSDSTEMYSNELDIATYPPLLHAGANPFDDRFEDKEYEWSSDSSRSATPVSFLEGAKSLYDDVLARRASQAGPAASHVDFRSSGPQDTTLPAGSLPSAVPAGSNAEPASPPGASHATMLPSQALAKNDAPASTSPIPGVAHSIPSFGGYVEEGKSVLASERILREVKWGFVDADLSKSGRRPRLEYEGDFPRGAQLSLLADADGRQPYSSFAVEARTWQGLLIYLMWHGDSRFEAAPSDLERDKAARGYQASVSLDFYRSPSSSGAAVSIRPPRVRARLTLLPLSIAPPSHPDSTTSETAISIISTPSFDAVNPNIRLELTLPPTLPIALSSLASTLADAAALARRTVEAQQSRHGKAPAVTGPSPGQQALVNAIALFRRLGGEEPADRPDARAHEEEASLLHRMKARLKRRKVIQRLPTDPNADPSEGLPLPEGALMITPFPLDRYIDESEAK